jgi:gamma-glutamyltranspeptidase/glutathione hydrolase
MRTHAPALAPMIARWVIVAASAVACRGAGDASNEHEAPAIPPRVVAVFPEGWRFSAGSRTPVEAPTAMVASNSGPASEAGVEILRRGGNAVDAAVAVGFALAVTYPEAGNIGGGGYMVIRMADGTTAALDYRETAPLAATRDMYVDANGRVTEQSRVGHLASGVPGAVAGMADALARHGTMSLAEVMAPAIRLAKDGFVVDSAQSASLANARALIGRFAGAAVWLRGDSAPSPGTTFRQPVLARTLEQIAERGPDAFYRGAIADSIVAEMERGGGLITKADLEGYRPIWRTPLRTTYRGHTLLTMPPSSSGGVTISESLNLLETWDTIPAPGSAAWVHRLASVYQLAFIDRNEKIADPGFVTVPLAELTSKEYARELRRRIDPARHTATRTLTARTPSPEGTQTTHYSVVDAAGNAVATTTTINELYGSGVYVGGAGFFLNNEMDDFTAQPGTPNLFGLVQGEQNAIEPGKRMLSAMSPTIVLDSADDVLLVLGSRGGPRIITSTSQVILNVIDHRMSLGDAMAAPRFHHQALPDTLRYEPGGLEPAVRDSLMRMGHGLATYPSPGLVIAIMRGARGWEGVVDPRSAGGVKGY